MGDKSAHKRKTKGQKGAKRKAAALSKGNKNNDGATTSERSLAGKLGKGGSEKSSNAPKNPKAFVFASRGRAKIQKARSAEKEQRRMHGEHGLSATGVQPFLMFLSSCAVGACRCLLACAHPISDCSILS